MIKKHFPNVRIDDIVRRLNDDEARVAIISSVDEAGWGNMIAWNPAAEYRYKMTTKVDTAAAEMFVAEQSAMDRYIVGYLSYDVGASLHGVVLESADDLIMPDVYLLSFDSYVTFSESGATVISPRNEFESEVSKILQRPLKISDRPTYSENLTPVVDKVQYGGKYQQVQQHIIAGDIYQANLTHRLEGRTERSGREIFHRSLQKGAANFGAYIEGADFEIISNSPERFVRIDEHRIDTFPIKGTRPRGKNEVEDRLLKHELLTSEKDAAELNMITDLMRNDLGEICEIGTVKVNEHRVVTQLPTVWHTHSHVSGRLPAHMTPMAALVSLMPGGSITGCPKKRAIEIIDQLESTRRGVYTGTIFYISPDGTLDSNITIRTLIKKSDNLYLSVGGGIVYDSDESSEYQESLDKAAFWRNLDDKSRLSSDILESQFGPTHVEILYQNDNERIIRTVTDSDGKILEVSYVKFNADGVKKFPEIHADIITGESIGKAFRKKNVLFSRNQPLVQRTSSIGIFKDIFESSKDMTTVKVEVTVGTEAVLYAEIFEVYHSDVRWPDTTVAVEDVSAQLDMLSNKLANL